MAKLNLISEQNAKLGQKQDELGRDSAQMRQKQEELALIVDGQVLVSNHKINEVVITGVIYFRRHRWCI